MDLIKIYAAIKRMTKDMNRIQNDDIDRDTKLEMLEDIENDAIKIITICENIKNR